MKNANTRLGILTSAALAAGLSGTLAPDATRQSSDTAALSRNQEARFSGKILKDIADPNN